jgi:hypothetical protein
MAALARRQAIFAKPGRDPGNAAFVGSPERRGRAGAVA